MNISTPNRSFEQLELGHVEQSADAQVEVQQKRDQVLRAVASGHLNTMQERVAWILNHHPETRDSDITLQLHYWREFDGFSGGSIDVTRLLQANTPYVAFT